MKRLQKEKGITLIALVVTIIVLLILAGISINLIFGQDGIINAAKQAARRQAQAEKEEEVRLAITALLLRNGYDESKVTVSAVVEEVKKNYTKQEEKNSISGSTTGEVEDRFPGVIQYEKPSSRIDETIIVQVDENLNVTSKLDEPEPPIELPQSEYKKVGETYYNTPELMKFNPKCTYYITYDASGNNETVYGRLDKVAAPTDWYDYENQKWANLATVNGDQVTYWTWIPRYMYKIGDEEKANETVDIKFVDVNNQYQGKDEETVDLKDYQLPESFTFAEKPLSGYWMSKYEIQESDSSGLEKLVVIGTSDNKLNVTTSSPSGKYTIFLDGEKNISGVELPYDIENIQTTESHEVLLISETTKNIVGDFVIEANDSIKNIEVDTSGFNPECTYYITYEGEDKKETVYGRMDKVDRPTNWYDYDNKIWANLVTVNESEITYWTYIPRYEYIAYSGTESVIVRYIKSTQTKANNGYKIPESFTFGEGENKNLKGYWISKYEIQDSNSNVTERTMVQQGEQELTVTTSKPSGTYTIFLDGEKKISGVNLPYKLENVDTNKEHDILVLNETEGKLTGNVKAAKTTQNIEIDLRGFSTSNTYYVTYDEDGGNEKIGNLIEVDSEGKPINPPSNWYNYDKKIWANIVTKGKNESGKELITYWTYIPRYEYVAYPKAEGIDIKYIPVSQTTADLGYKIPESFTFAGKDLKGYWISKYEIQNEE